MRRPPSTTMTLGLSVCPTLAQSLTCGDAEEDRVAGER
jgi:hypothetical protein